MDNIRKMRDGLPDQPLPGMPVDPQLQYLIDPSSEQVQYQAELEKVLELKEANETGIQDLLKQGVQIDQPLVTHLRLLTFLDFHLGGMDGSRPQMSRWPRLQYERNFHNAFAEKLDEARSAIRQAKLTQGIAPRNGNPPGGLYIPGKS